MPKSKILPGQVPIKCKVKYKEYVGYGAGYIIYSANLSQHHHTTSSELST